MSPSEVFLWACLYLELLPWTAFIVVLAVRAVR